MSTADPRAGTAPWTHQPAPAPPRAYRATDHRLLGGVAAGLAAHLGVPVAGVRVAFVLGILLGGFSVFVYAGLWLFLPAARHLEEGAPGLDAARRQGRRGPRTSRLADVGPLVALVAVAIGLAVLVDGWLGYTVLFWPLLLGAAGLGVLWWQADEAQRERWVDSTGRVDVVRALVGSGGFSAYARLATGLALLVGALVMFALQSGRATFAGDVLLAAALGVVGLALTVGPWLVRLVGDLSEERSARVRTEERADMAAHLHDSVLQTLALIQKHAGDRRRVATLARAQERDLRRWLYGDLAEEPATLAGALRDAAAEVEDTYGVPVEVVTVGDAGEDPAAGNGGRLRPLVLAAREAMVNAAKHSGAAQVDVYAECDDGRCEVFVRDRGQGYDPAAVPEDRLGVRHSIEERVRRHGGTVEIRTAPGAGTEVRLMVPLAGEPPARDEEDEG